MGYLSGTKPEKMFYDYNQEEFTDKDKNFLRFVTDASNSFQEFVDAIGYHKDGFESIITDFKVLINYEQTDEEGKVAMTMRIKELEQTILMLSYVLSDIKKNPFGKHIKPQPE